MKTNLVETGEVAAEDSTTNPGPFPVDALSPVLRDIAVSVSEVYQIPTSMPAMSALAVHAGATGKTFKLTGAVDAQSSYANLFVMASAGRGEGKGSVAAVIASPLLKASNNLALAFQPKKAGIQAEVEVLNSEITHLKKGVNKPGANRSKILKEITEKKSRIEEIQPGGRDLQAPTYHEGNCTSEALTASLRTHDQAILSYSPEAGDLVRVALGKYAKGAQGDFDLLLSGWSSETTANNRVGSGRVHLVPTISALWFAQPVILQELLANKEAFERGLSARLLIFDSKIELKHDDGRERVIAQTALDNWHAAIEWILDMRENGVRDCHVQCGPEAKEVFREFFNHGIDLRIGTCSDVAGELSRWRENAIRVALNLWIGDGMDGDVTAEQAERAVRIARWCGLSYLSILRKGRVSGMHVRAKKLRELLLQTSEKSCSLRDLETRHGFTHDEVRKLAGAFPDMLEVVTKPTSTNGGRPSELVRIPKPV